MKYYNDQSNEAAAALLFMLFQMVMLLIVYGIVYTAIVGVRVAMQKYGLGVVVFSPEIIALILYPTVLYRTRRMFKAGKKLRAVAWCMAWASLIIVVLYLHLDRLTTL